MGGRPKWFGEVSPEERKIIEEIVFLREIKKKTFQGISDELNAQSKWPRRALKWTSMLVFHVWKNRRGNRENAA